MSQAHLHTCPSCGQKWECFDTATTWDMADTDCRYFAEIVCEACVRERQRAMLAAILCLNENGDFFFNDSELEQLAGSDDYPETLINTETLMNPFTPLRRQ
jgi:hypothetical protein